MRKLRANDGNCLVVGCVGAAVVAALLAVAVGGITWYTLNRLIDQYTDDAPVDLPVVEMAQEELDALIVRVDEYRTALEEGEARGALELTQDDLNALIQYHDDLDFFRGKLYITLDDDRVGGELSIPLDDLPIPGMGGRYFNGSATFDIEIRNGRLAVYLESASIKGEPVPEEFMIQIRSENFAAGLNTTPEGQELLENVDTLEVRDGRLIFTPTQPSGEEAEVEAESAL